METRMHGAEHGMGETTKEQLLLMMKQYEIGRKPLSRLLGWGDTTVLRYLDGVRPNPEFAGRIAQLYRDPWAYASVLEQGRERLTPLAYRKSRQAVDRLLTGDRTREAIQLVIAAAAGDIAPSGVIAVLHYAQVQSLAVRGYPLFEEEVCLDLKQEQPYPVLYARLLRDGVRDMQSMQGTFTAEERELLEHTLQLLNGYSPNAIRSVWKHDKRLLRRVFGAAGRESTSLCAAQLQQGYEVIFQKTGGKEGWDLRTYFAGCLKRKV